MICQADARRIPLADETVQCVVTSPPYWGLRDYGLATWEGGDAECEHGPRLMGNANKGNVREVLDGNSKTQCYKCGAIRHDAGIGLEKTPEEYVANIVAVFREVKRVLRPDGTLWLNLGDCYAGSWGSMSHDLNGKAKRMGNNERPPASYNQNGLKPKDLVGIPWRVAFALQADGWYLRSDIIWSKNNPMPESVTDRPTKSHEYVFLLAKQATYYYDAEAIAEELKRPDEGARTTPAKFGGALKHVEAGKQSRLHSGNEYLGTPNGKRNRRDVWTIPTSPYKGAHFATFPPALVEPCILAGTSAKGNCPVCGKPWERVTERAPVPVRPNFDGKRGSLPKSAERDRQGGDGIDRAGNSIVRTTNWRPTCDHGAEPIPAIVLDPFCGSGTVGAGCRKYGRRFVGLDLSMKYLRELALPRAEGTQAAGANNDLPLFAEAEAPQAD